MTPIRLAAIAAPICIWLVLTAVGLLTRPLLPIDETRYLSVAWEMWASGDWLVPHLNGELYGQKPPLLFWLILAGWKLFGVSEIWARLVAPLAGLGALFLTAALARQLWPAEQRDTVAVAAPVVLIGTLLWVLFTTVTMFDTLMTVFTLLGALGAVRARKGFPVAGFSLLGLAIGLGVLAKGPVILVYLLPLVIFLPFSGDVANRPPARRWYAGVALALVGGGLITALWVVPAVIQGGEAFADEILWRQTASRVVSSFAHRRSLWWYLPLLPLLLFPWSFWPPMWRRIGAALRHPFGSPAGLCLLWFLSGVAIFSLVSGKQIHYLLPLMPAFALAVAGGMAEKNRVITLLDHRVSILVPAVLGTAIVLAVELFEGVSPGTLPDLPPWGWEVGEILGTALLIGAVILGLFPAVGVRRHAGLMALVTFIVFSSLHVLGMPQARADFDLQPMATRISESVAEGRPVVYAGNYQGEFHFLGRLRVPIEEIDEAAIGDWLAANPTGRVVTEMDARELSERRLEPIFRQNARSKILMMLDPSSLP